MKTPALLAIATLGLLLPAATSAQQAPPATPPAGEMAQPAVPQDPGAAPIPAPPPSETPPPTGEPPAPSPEERLAEVESKVEGLAESASQTQSTVDSLSKLKVSGYIQGRFEWHDDANSGLTAPTATAVGRPAETNRFYVRRGRLKATYAGRNAEYILQIDAIGDGVTLKDAEATFVDTWTPLGLRLTVGQFKWPFGYEVLQSSGEREMPERSRVVRVLFPGERDRGVRLQGSHDWLRFSLALVNGNGTQDAVYTTFDQTSWKDLVGRVGGDFGFLVVGASGWWGYNLKTTVPAAPAPAVYESYKRARVGTDAQLYLDIPGLGGLALKGEFIWAKDTMTDFAGGAAVSACKDVTSVGWYVTAVQNFGDYLGAVVRVDQFDPSTDTDGCDDTVTAQATTIANATVDKITTVGGGLLIYPSGNLRGTIVYEHPIEQKTDTMNKKVANDFVTFQLQAKF